MIKKMYVNVLALFLAVFAVGLVAPSSVHAVLTVPVLDTADFLAVAAAVLVAIAIFYGIRKALALLNR